MLIEYDNTQNVANHIHSIWHDLRRNWGRELLREQPQPRARVRCGGAGRRTLWLFHAL